MQSGEILNTALKVFTGAHQISVQSLDSAGNVTATASLNVVAEQSDVPGRQNYIDTSSQHIRDDCARLHRDVY